jgi:hypothetical protein
VFDARFPSRDRQGAVKKRFEPPMNADKLHGFLYRRSSAFIGGYISSHFPRERPPAGQSSGVIAVSRNSSEEFAQDLLRGD